MVAVAGGTSRSFRPHWLGGKGFGVASLVAAIAVIVLILSFWSGLPTAPASHANLRVADEATPVVTGPLTPVPLGPSSSIAPGSRVIDRDPSSPLHVVITLAYTNQSVLSNFLAELSNPKSPVYHHYLTETQFVSDFSPSLSTWDAIVGVVEGAGVSNLTLTPDRVMIAFDASPATVDSLFHTTIRSYEYNGTAYLAPSTPPELPKSLASPLLQIDGLDTYSPAPFQTLGGLGLSPTHRMVPTGGAPPKEVSGYLPPVTIDGIQLQYAPDFQVAYDEQSLFATYGDPTNATVATILWSGNYTGSTVQTPCGTLTDGENVGPWVPADIYDFYNETLPSGEPHSSLTAVPIDGAPGPSCLASWDSTGANGENTLDLEMVGSAAPGSHIYNVYGPAATSADLDQAFETILSPPTTLPPSVQAGLENVTVISNSWGGPDQDDSNWAADLQQAQARGISVLASSGDSDDNDQSQKYNGLTTVDFPASMAYDDYGDTAVGGTTVTLNPTTLQIQNQVVWNISAADSSDGGPAGSTGGVSLVFSEPTWQSSTEANSVISAAGQGAGRGVPDIAGLANNTLITLTIEGYQYRASNATNGGIFVYAWGTSIASPLTAGMIAEIDHVLKSANNPVLGFLNPTMYTVANDQYAALPSAFPGVGAEPTGPYLYSLPTTPFYDITSGSNYLYPALTGYDLVTGWGSLDAYNYTMYVLDVSSSGVYGHLAGIQDQFDLSNLEVTSTGPESEFNASTQQNFFLANSLGAPIYWIQNVVYINGTPSSWQMNFTGWVVFPFWAMYPYDTVYEYNWPASGLIETTPLDFDFTTELQNPGGLSAEIVFSFGVSGTTSLTLPVPGASYLIGSLDYTYSWQGVNYTNGGSAYAPGPGFLSPQFGLVGGPSGGLGDFGSKTAGTLEASVEPWGTSVWQPALTQTFGLSTTQTGEEAKNLGYTQTGSNAWTLESEPGSETQGVLAYQNPVPYEFTVQFNQTNVPAGTPWYVNITGGPSLVGPASDSSLTAQLLNGTYRWMSGLGAWNWSISPASGTVHVAGKTVYVDLTAAHLPTYLLQFNESGVPLAATWYVNLTGHYHLSTTGSTPSLSVEIVNGSFPWTAAVGITNWSVTPASGIAVVDGQASYVDLAFAPLQGLVDFVETGLPSGTLWWANITGVPGLSSTTVNVSSLLDYGTFTATFATSNKEYSALSAAFSVPTSAPIAVTFGPVTYNVSATATYAGGAIPYWQFTVGSVTVSGAEAIHLLKLMNGSHTFSASVAQGYTIAPGIGTFVVHGGPQSISLTITENASGHSSGSSLFGLTGSTLDLVLGLVALGVVLVALVVVLVWRKRKESGPSSPPPSAGGS